MKVNELMIGDWVLFEPIKNDSTPKRVGGIDGSMVSINCLWEAFHHIRPIPLTEEIIKKNGFVNDFYEDESVADYHVIRHEGYSFNTEIALITWCNGNVIISTDFDGKVSKEIQFVHELQHALRLCGLNELADNLKL